MGQNITKTKNRRVPGIAQMLKFNYFSLNVVVLRFNKKVYSYTLKDASFHFKMKVAKLTLLAPVLVRVVHIIV